MNKPALVVMARAPQAGMVKTRLQPVLTPAQCAQLSEAFLGDAIELAGSMAEYTPFLALTPLESAPLLNNPLPAAMQLIPQVGNGVGQIMDNLIKTLSAKKYAPVVIIGSDIPMLQPDTLRRALLTLKDFDICLGPSSDGGYYLIGANRPVSALFRGIPWSTSGVLKITKERARAAGLSVVLLEKLSDVDTIEDLALTEEKLRWLRGEPGTNIPLRTEAWLKARQANNTESDFRQ